MLLSICLSVCLSTDLETHSDISRPRGDDSYRLYWSRRYTCWPEAGVKWTENV